MKNRHDGINLFIYEEQELFREIYAACWPASQAVKVAGTLSDFSHASLAGEVCRTLSDVLLIGAKRLSHRLLSELEELNNNSSGLGLVFLLGDVTQVDIERLRRIATSETRGFALFKKLSIESSQHLEKTILAVADGQVLLDPLLASWLFEGKAENGFLQQLTAREREILKLLSQGFTNGAIAETLFIDIKTVEHHLNSLYGKLKADPDYNSMHLRVSAARLYYENAAAITTGKNQEVLAGIN